MKKLLVILGPTATGKTDIALELAKKFKGELVACDSRQIYQGLDIGTGKMPGKKELQALEISRVPRGWEVNGIKIWMYDVARPQDQYSVFDYVLDANKIIREIEEREKLPIIVGGTGLYLKGLLGKLDMLQVPVNPSLRARLQKMPLGELQGKLATLSPTVWENLNQSDRCNPRRLIRQIEQVSMYPYKDTSPVSNFQFSNHDILKIGLTAPRAVLNSRIDSRLDSRINQGLVSEGKKLLESGVTLERMRQLGLEYGCLASLLEGKLTEAEFTQKLKFKIHQYAKRQLTWFKKEPGIRWFDITEGDISHRVEIEVENWYND